MQFFCKDKDYLLSWNNSNKRNISYFCAVIAIFIQSFKIRVKKEIPFRLTITNNDNLNAFNFCIRPSQTISVKMYEDYGLDR